MGKNPWDELDPDIRAMSSGLRREGGGRRWATLGLFVLGLAGVTLLLAYYVPLRQAHGALIEEHKKLAAKAKEAERAALDAQRELEKSERHRGELEHAAEQRESERAAVAGRREALAKTLDETLGKSAKKGAYAVGTTPNGVVVALADSALFTPKKLDLSTDGRKLLCAVEGAAGKNKLGVHAPTDAKASGALRQKYPSVWAFAAARAAAVTEALESKCGASRQRLRAGAASPSRAGVSFEGGKPPSPRVEIEIEAE
ncbi:MAG TPA: hypothetical protein VKY73_16215 [Polyangiaceae bacterium]|nr:hypothetical protein [Polyangiaceae bacterium]